MAYQQPPYGPPPPGQYPPQGYPPQYPPQQQPPPQHLVIHRLKPSHRIHNILNNMAPPHNLVTEPPLHISLNLALIAHPPLNQATLNMGRLLHSNTELLPLNHMDLPLHRNMVVLLPSSTNNLAISSPISRQPPPSLGYGAPQLIQWNAGPDADALRKAMKGFGTDERTLINVLAGKDPLQMSLLRTTYRDHHKRDLLGDVQSETSGDLEDTLSALIRGPLEQDCHLLYVAMEGPGTKEKVLNDVLLGRSNADIIAIKGFFHSKYHQTLESFVKGDLSGKTERHFLMVLSAKRNEEATPVIPQEMAQEAEKLYRATEGKMGTDELTEFSGHMEDALIYQLRTGTDKAMRDATLLEDTMAGVGTKETLLLNRVVRIHWDRNHMAQVKGAYQHKYRTSLASRIKGEARGDFEHVLLAILGD
ncbi:hypothetical protein B7494_g4643 [Chlorociboria aeruginascens]|nr:hypothetical protein B7494_g4643 [Chlorociboria aeruginascens]